MKIVFFGTPNFASHILEKLVEHGLEIVCVVTKPDKPQGRKLQLKPCPVKQYTLTRLPNVPLLQPEKCSTPECAETLRAVEADLFVVVAYGEIISQLILDIPPLGCINVHGSILPKYRGAAPIHRAIISGEKETGVSIIRMVRKMDAGDVLGQEKVGISQDATFSEMEAAVCAAGARCLIKVIEEIKKGTHHAAPQDPALVTFAPKITPEECFLSWSRPVRELHNLIRGTSLYPGAWCKIRVRGEEKRLKILRSRIKDLHKHTSPGAIVHYDTTEFVVSCGEGLLEIVELQLEGKPAMPASEFVKGIPVTHLSLTI